MITMQIDNKDVIAALQRAPRAVTKHIDIQMGRAAREVAREARRVVPTSFMNLKQSIESSRVSPFEFYISPDKNYATVVEQGRKPGKMPNPDALQPWVEKELRVRGHEAKNKAFLIARSIARNGIKPQPYMQPTADKMAGRVIQLVRFGVADGLHEAGFA